MSAEVPVGAPAKGHSVRVDAALVEAISKVLRDHDPLDPWLTESSWDEGYWDDEAAAIGALLRSEMTANTVRAVVVDVLGPVLGQSADGDAGLEEQARRLTAASEAIATILQRRS